MADVAGGSVVWNLDVVDKGFTSGLAKAGAEAKAFGSTVDKLNFTQVATNASAAFGGIANSIARAATRLTLFAAAGTFGIGAFVKSAADLQTTSKSFQVLIGNADRANQLFAQIKRFADTTPFQFPELANSARVLLGFGVGVNDVFKRLKVLGDISAVTGADLQSLAVVFGQVTGAGRLMGQDALQLVNNNIPITTILTKRLGITAGELRKRIEAGTISAQDFTDALTGITEKGGIAFKGTDELAKTFNGRMSTLKDTVAEFGRNLIGVKVDPQLGLVVKPGGVFDRLSKAIPDISKGLQEMAPRLISFVEFIVRNGNTVVAIIGAIAAAFLAAKLAAIGFGLVTALSNPFTAIALAITLLVGLLVFLQLRFGFLTKAIAAIKPVLDPVVAVFQFLFHLLADQLDPIIQFISQHADIFKKIAIALAVLALAPLAIAIGVVVAGIAVAIAVITAVIFAFNKFMQVVNFVSDFVVGAIRRVIDIMQFLYIDIPKRIIGAFAGAGGWLLEAGKDLIRGLINGVKQMAGALVDAVKGTVTGAIDGAKKLLHIKSPSQVFADIGKNVGLGLVQGLDKTQGIVQASMSSLVGGLGLDSDFTVAPNLGAVRGAGEQTGASTSIVQNNNIYNQVDLDQVTRDLAWRVAVK